MATRDRSEKTNSIFFGKNSATRELLGLRISLPFGGPKRLPRDQYYLHVPFSDIYSKTRDEISIIVGDLKNFTFWYVENLYNISYRKLNDFVNSNVTASTMNQGSVLSGTVTGLIGTDAAETRVA